jgi:hypothetical protein
MDEQRPTDEGSIDHASASSYDRHPSILMRLLASSAVIAILWYWGRLVHPHEMIGFMGMVLAFCALIGFWCSRFPFFGAAVEAAFLPVTFLIIVICFEIGAWICLGGEKIISLFR